MSGTDPLPLRPAFYLEGEAADTWQAYNAMQSTKQRHYEMLRVLEDKKKNFNLDTTELDRTLLANLLADHSWQVDCFTEASVALKSANPIAHKALFEYIGALNRSSDQDRVVH